MVIIKSFFSGCISGPLPVCSCSWLTLSDQEMLACCSTARFTLYADRGVFYSKAQLFHHSSLYCNFYSYCKPCACLKVCHQWFYKIPSAASVCVKYLDCPSSIIYFLSPLILTSCLFYQKLCGWGGGASGWCAFRWWHYGTYLRWWGWGW